MDITPDSFCFCTICGSAVLSACSNEPAGIEDLRSDEERREDQVSENSIPEVNTGDSDTESTIISSPNSSFTCKIIEGENGWGYQIFEGESIRINQMHIPSVPGIRGFDSKTKASIAANYVLNEINKGNFPPTVSPEILDSIGAL